MQDGSTTLELTFDLLPQKRFYTSKDSFPNLICYYHPPHPKPGQIILMIKAHFTWNT